MVAASLVSESVSAYAVGREVDADELVGWAEKAYSAHRSSETRDVLVSALLNRAARRLGTKLPEVDRLARASRRSVGGAYVLAMVATVDPGLTKKMLADADAHRAARLLKEDAAAFPVMLSGWRWAILAAFYPKDREEFTRRLLGGEIQRLGRSIGRKTSPLAGPSALEAYFVLRAAGKEREARTFLEEQVKLGIPLPLPRG